MSVDVGMVVHEQEAKVQKLLKAFEELQKYIKGIAGKAKKRDRIVMEGDEVQERRM